MFSKKSYTIPLDTFINNALYHPKNGYYTQRIPFGKYGDFITAPNISTIFSEMIFLWIISYWEKFYKHEKINLVELGAGNGEMMSQIIRSSKRFDNFFSNCEFMIYEKSPKLIKLQKKNLKGNNVKWLTNLNNIKNKPTIFFGNEFLDALPIKQFIKLKKIWYERHVEKKGKTYRFKDIKCNINKIKKKLKLNITKKQDFLEISFEEIKIIKQLNNIISEKGGSILLIDYAYLDHKMMNTLQAVKKHKKINILKKIGSSDITHVINIPFLKQIAKQFNLKIDYTSQRNFLLKLGILKRAEILATNKKFLEKANIFYRINRLIDNSQMGEIFKILHIYKNKKFKLGFL